MELLENPKFILGVLAGLFVSFVVFNLIESKKYSKMSSEAYLAKKRINNMLESARSGARINLNEYYAPKKISKNSRSVGFLFWKDLALWLTCVYDEYKYVDSPIDEFFELARMIFGHSCAYEKLEALNETLNRSTAYILPGWPDQNEKKVVCRKNLLKMVFMIINSYSDEVYERNRVDVKRT